MQLLEQNKVDLRKSVSEYLPNFAPKNPWSQHPILLEHLVAFDSKSSLMFRHRIYLDLLENLQ